MPASLRSLGLVRGLAAKEPGQASTGTATSWGYLSEVNSQLAVDVSPPDDFIGNEDYGSSISGWKVLWNKIAPWKTTMQMPSLGAVMQRAAETASNVRQRDTINNMTDLYIKMPVDKYGLLAFNRAAEIRATGYAHAKTVFEGWSEREGRDTDRTG